MNIMIIANEDAVMDDDGRRYTILDIATHRQVIPNCDSERNIENRKYWDKVYSCFNDEVGHAFYCYLMEVDTTNYVPQDFPTTQSKLDSYAKRMDSHENFLKYNYVLNHSGKNYETSQWQSHLIQITITLPSRGTKTHRHIACKKR